MAIYFHQSYSKNRGIRNFGDDINPCLLGKIFHKSIIESDEICLIGIGTILNDRELTRVDHYKKKIVFSSGVGYGSLNLSRFDSSWDFACVRGPRSATALNLEPEKAIADGAILLSDFQSNSAGGPEKKYATTFIPHVESDLASGFGLKKLCDELGIHYLSPSVGSRAFMLDVERSEKVLTEAMHGAIVADALRVPWVPMKFHVHERFKWEDWCESMNLPYSLAELGPAFWDTKQGSFSRIKQGWQFLKARKCKKNLRRILFSCAPMLSESAIFEDRKKALLTRVQNINDRYAGQKK
ncbi:polysaccharide pyruvyl transferase family protein [Marinobacter halophilus]|uniref:Polysaccharide pyruvyl transferase domain-containing protein n=1 Tax=Marinobacter halophilus TaxID=1323740 RepID=A0A2T1K8J8_9GAMM|nr:polysaccharide pyruvyl transferase family protein [Marinobacter halophilus]PSF06455.1 hypothetical protein C7H08_15210 [Marinobacter halophilus]GGC72762.1 hypothetical protein GCM10011362_21580 [Marinobacter halophilus]